MGIAGGAPGMNAVVEAGLPGGYDLIVLTNPTRRPPSASRGSCAGGSAPPIRTD
jgi:hypothetical protein